MGLGINKVISEGNGNTILYTALIAAAVANTLPTPFDAIYFRRVNKFQREYDDGKISPEKLETHVALEYYAWTSLWYLTLFSTIYAYGGKYKTNATLLVALAAGGLVVGSVQKNIEMNKKAMALKQSKTSEKSFNGSEEITCTNCGWKWNTSDSKASDKYTCHKCGKINEPYKPFTANEETFWNDAFDNK
jgi:DNA-directed RNA polymerase subunit RPC12/RpoP